MEFDYSRGNYSMIFKLIGKHVLDLNRLDAFDLIEKKLSEAQVVYAHEPHPTIETWHWDTCVDASQGAKRKALLVCIEEIEKKCEHKSVSEVASVRGFERYECDDCGKAVKSIGWTEV